MPPEPAVPRRRGRRPLHPVGDDVTRRRVGEARPRGRLARLEGRFRLAEDLDAPGLLPLDDAFERIQQEWQRQVAEGAVVGITVKHYAEHMQSFLRFANRARGCVNLADVTVPVAQDWVVAPSPQNPGAPLPDNTIRMRRSALRSFFHTAVALGLTDQNPALSVDLPQRHPRFVNAATKAQVDQCKRVAVFRLDETRMPALLALVLMGGTLAEAAYTRVKDVDLPGRKVWLHDGGVRAQDRWVPLDDDWCFDALRKRVDALTASVPSEALADAFLTYENRREPTYARRAAASASMMAILFKKARITGPGVRAEGLREHLAQRVFAETGRVEAVAARLGMGSLDAAAHIVGHDWTVPYGINDAPPEPATCPDPNDPHRHAPATDNPTDSAPDDDTQDDDTQDDEADA